MKTLLAVIRRLCRIAGFAGMFLAIWLFFDPSAFPQADFGMLPLPSPRWRAVLLLLCSLALVGYGSGFARRKSP